MTEEENIEKYNATNTLNKYFKISNEFEKIKNYIKENEKTYLNYFYNFFNINLKNYFINPNFYHYTSEAWLITIFSQLKNDIEDELTIFMKKGIYNFNYRFYHILQKIQKIKLDDDLFIQNLEILLGTYKIPYHVIKITQMKLSKIYLKNLQVFIDSTISSTNTNNLSKQKFEEILMLIFKKALNSTLIELDSTDKENNSDLLLSTYIGLCLQHEKKPTFEQYHEEINRIKNKSDKNEQINTNSDIELENADEIFYYFAIIDFSDLLKDIQLFTINSSSFLSKIEYIIKFRLLKLKSYTNILINSFINSKRMKSIYDYFRNVYILYLKNVNKTLKFTSCNISRVESQIEKSYLVNLSKDFCSFSKQLLFNNIITPVHGVFMFYKKATINILIDSQIYTQKKISSICNKFTENLYENTYPIINFNNQGKYVNLEINFRKISIINNTIERIVSYLKQLTEYSHKNTLVNKFIGILGISDNPN